MGIDFTILQQDNKGLRDYQVKAKQDLYKAWSKHDVIMLQMPTGTGKTMLFSSIVKDIHNLSADKSKAYKVLILAHREELIEQIDKSIGLKYNVAHGIIKSKHQEQTFYPTQIASVQTLVRRVEKWKEKDFDFIIVDEAHHVLADSYKKICKTFPNAKILGVTATPCRLNGEPFTPMFDKLIITMSVNNFIKQGYLCDYDYYSIPRNSFTQGIIDDIKIDERKGDYDEVDMANKLDKDYIRAHIIDTYKEYAQGKKGIVYTINKAHNKNICNKFRVEGLRVEAIDSDTPSEERKEIVDKFREGKIDILCNVNIFTEGFDCPDVEFIQLARPTQSLTLYLQQVGRGLRTHENKKEVFILDNVGLYNRFGYPSANRKWRYRFEGKYFNEEEEINDLEDNHNVKLIKDKLRERNCEIEEGNEQTELIYSSKTIETIEELEKIEHIKTNYKVGREKLKDIEYKGFWIVHNELKREFEALSLLTNEIEYSNFGQGNVKNWIDKVGDKIGDEEVYKGFRITFDKRRKEYIVIKNEHEEYCAYNKLQAKQWIDKITYKEKYKGFELIFNEKDNIYIAKNQSTKENEYNAKEINKIKQWIDKIVYSEEYRGFKMEFNKALNKYIALNQSTKENEYNAKEIYQIKEWIDKIVYSEEYRGFKIEFNKALNKYIALNQSTKENGYNANEIYQIKEWIDKIRYSEEYKGYKIDFNKTTNKYIAINQSTKENGYNANEIYQIKEWIDKRYSEEYKGFEIGFHKMKFKYIAIHQSTKEIEYYSEEINQIKEWIDNIGYKIGYTEDYKGYEITFNKYTKRFIATNIRTRAKEFSSEYSINKIKTIIDKITSE